MLALVFPERYAVMDFRTWRQLFPSTRFEATVQGYRRCTAAISILADELGWLPQEVDLAIWEYDRGAGSPAS